jgi:hypothetical protein
MIRVHREQAFGLTESAAGLRLDQLKFPTETIYFGVRPNVNIGTMTRWNKYHDVVQTLIPFPVAVPNPVPPPAFNLQFSLADWERSVPLLNTVILETHGVKLYRETPATFFNGYMPMTYGSSNVMTPDDPGMYMMNFNLYPGSYNASGYINLSRTRELFLYYTSTSPSIVASQLVVIGIAINFLLISEGSAVLRYNV